MQTRVLKIEQWKWTESLIRGWQRMISEELVIKSWFHGRKMVCHLLCLYLFKIPGIPLYKCCILNARWDLPLCFPSNSHDVSVRTLKRDQVFWIFEDLNCDWPKEFQPQTDSLSRSRPSRALHCSVSETLSEMRLVSHRSILSHQEMNFGTWDHIFWIIHIPTYLWSEYKCFRLVQCGDLEVRVRYIFGTGKCSITAR